MKWIDISDDSIALGLERGYEVRRITRDEYLALDANGRRGAGTAFAVEGMGFRGEADHRWIRVVVADLDATDLVWRIWDTRFQPPTILCAGIPDRALALSLASVAASSRVVRRGLGAAMVMAAAAEALRETWRRA